jgi:hypothetical protein
VIQLIDKTDLTPIFKGNQNSSKILLVSLYTIGIMQDNFDLKYISNAILTLRSRTIINEKTVRNTLKKLIELKIIDVDYDEKKNKKYISSVHLKTKEEMLEIFKNKNCKIDNESFTNYSVGSRLSLHKVRGIGKIGESFYLKIKELGFINMSEIYNLRPNIIQNNRAKEIRNRILLLIRLGFLYKNENDEIRVTDKPLVECENIIKAENKDRKRKLQSDAANVQQKKLKNERDGWILLNNFQDLEKISHQLAEKKYKPEELRNFRDFLKKKETFFQKHKTFPYPVEGKDIDTNTQAYIDKILVMLNECENIISKRHDLELAS